MFAGFDTGIPGASWFAPSLEVSTVADLIIGCIESGGSQVRRNAKAEGEASFLPLR